VRRDRAIRKLLHAWKERDAVKNIMIVRWKHRRTSAVDEALHAALDELDIKRFSWSFKMKKVTNSSTAFNSRGLMGLFSRPPRSRRSCRFDHREP
jgi:hypothetical protein